MDNELQCESGPVHAAAGLHGNLAVPRQRFAGCLAFVTLGSNGFTRHATDWHRRLLGKRESAVYLFSILKTMNTEGGLGAVSPSGPLREPCVKVSRHTAQAFLRTQAGAVKSAWNTCWRSGHRIEFFMVHK